MSEIERPPPTLSVDDRQRVDALADESVATHDTLFGLSFDSPTTIRTEAITEPGSACSDRVPTPRCDLDG